MMFLCAYFVLRAGWVLLGLSGWNASMRGISQGLVEEQQLWLGKAKWWASGHLLFWGSEAQRGEGAPTLLPWPPLGVLTGLDSGLYSPAGYMPLLADGLRRRIGD